MTPVNETIHNPWCPYRYICTTDENREGQIPPLIVTYSLTFLLTIYDLVHSCRRHSRVPPSYLGFDSSFVTSPFRRTSFTVNLITDFTS